MLGTDPMTDIAVLRIDAKGLPTVQLGDPKALRVGDPVLAIGAPFGFEQTATQGIVSAKGRSLPGDAVVPFIQTDAAVNPGNSGGPLFDDAGRVVGINSQIYSRSGGYQGLAFAIPIDVALKVKDQIVATGKAQHARLGVTVQDLTQPLADSFGLKRPDGALVSSVSPDSAAAKAGLKAGDVITAVDGEPVVRSGELSSRIGLSSPGEQGEAEGLARQGRSEIQATLGSVDGRSARQGRRRRGRAGQARPGAAPADAGREARVGHRAGPGRAERHRPGRTRGRRSRRRAAGDQRQAGRIDRADPRGARRQAEERGAAGRARRQALFVPVPLAG